MKKLKTYLVGSIQDAKDGGVSWRDKITLDLVEMGFEVLDPTKMECNQTLAPTIEEQKRKLENLKRAGQWEEWDRVMDLIQQSDMVCVNSSEFIVVFYDSSKKLGGTIDEIKEALMKHIPIFVISYDPWIEWNDWVLRLCRKSFVNGGHIFPNVKQCLEHIETAYREYIKDFRQEAKAA